MKKPITMINGSQTFFFKSRCKFCRSGPRYVYYLLNKVITEKSFYKIKDFYESEVSSMRADDYYLEYSIKNRNFGPSYLFDSTSAALRKLPIPNMRYKQNDDRIGTVIECGCGKTSWSFTNSGRDHIKNRKCSLNIKANDILSLYRIMV